MWGELLFIFGLGALFYTYLFYPIILIGLNQRRTSFFSFYRASPANKVCLPSVTLVIAAYNEETVIAEKLKNSLKLDYPQHLLEIWVASDGSFDRTNNIVREYSKNHSRIRLLELPRRGKANVLNSAIVDIRSDIIVFSDANTEYQPDAVTKLVEDFINPEVGCVCGRLIYRNPNRVLSGEGESLYWLYETYLKKLESSLGYVAGANGSIYAARRELVDTLPPSTINDDFLISMRIIQKGYKSLYKDNAVAYEDVAPNVESEFKRHIRDAAGHYIAVFYLWGLMNPLLGMPSFIFWSHRLLRWSAPFILIALFVGNVFLLDQYIFRILFYLQTLFYAFAIIGFISRNNKLPLFIYLPFYFCNLNLSLFIGFIRAVFRLQKPAWESTQRQ